MQFGAAQPVAELRHPGHAARAVVQVRAERGSGTGPPVGNRGGRCGRGPARAGPVRRRRLGDRGQERRRRDHRRRRAPTTWTGSVTAARLLPAPFVAPNFLLLTGHSSHVKCHHATAVTASSAPIARTGDPNRMRRKNPVSLFDTRVPAVLLRTDRNPFHHGTLGAVRSLGRAGVDVHVVADCAQSPVRASRYVSALHTPPPPGASPADIAVVLRRVAARIARPAVLIPMDDACRRGGAAAGGAGARVPAARPAGRAARTRGRQGRAGRRVRVPGRADPETLVPDGTAEAARAAWRLGLPVVAKVEPALAGASGRRVAQHRAGAFGAGGRGAVPAGRGGGQPAAAPGVPAAGAGPRLVLPRVRRPLGRGAGGRSRPQDARQAAWRRS